MLLLISTSQVPCWNLVEYAFIRWDLYIIEMRRGDWTSTKETLKSGTLSGNSVMRRLVLNYTWHDVFHNISNLLIHPLNVSIQATALFTADRCEYCERPRDQYLLGIDRVVNSHGYFQGNCVSCCTRCNRMKSTHSRENFLSRMANNNVPETVGQGLDQLRDQLNNLKL